MIVQRIDDLPNFKGCKRLYLDVETTSFDDAVPALNSWAGHRIAGIAVCADDSKAYYLPIRHQNSNNLPIDMVMRWLHETLKHCGEWVNHNIKFDAHFVEAEGISVNCPLADTVVLAKMIDSDARTHALKPLCRAIGLEMEEELELKSWLKGAKTKDYGAIPADICGRYAEMDVIGNRALYEHLLEQLPEGMSELWETEKKLTSVLLDMERTGLKIDEKACKLAQLGSLRKMIQTSDEIEKLTGVELVNSPKCLFEIICTQLGLPVLARTESGGPSFDKHALKLYAGHPEVVTNERARTVLDLLRVFRTETQFKGLFADSFLAKSTNGILHPNYNQLVRTGRMSCSDPNSQQFNKRAKKLIVPRGAFFSTDASQVEFRVIAHYIKDQDVIAAYTNDASTDFHQWVADLCEVSRSPAKTLNFAMAYGAGKRRITQELSGNPKIMEEVGNEIDSDESIRPQDRAREYAKRCERRASEIYRAYHERLPGVKSTAERASAAARRKGFVRNAYGRRRHLPLAQTHKAFNSLVQGCAMDIIKEKMVELHSMLKDVKMVANVHDELLLDGPKEVIESPQFQRMVMEVLEGPTKIKVPIKWDWGTSRETWADA